MVMAAVQSARCSIDAVVLPSYGGPMPSQSRRSMQRAAAGPSAAGSQATGCCWLCV
eukprot:COSAG01_NODE_3460_length_6070_cov_10.278848_3_plen_56_part_00